MLMHPCPRMDAVTEWKSQRGEAILAIPTVSGKRAAAARVYVADDVAIFDARQWHWAALHALPCGRHGATRSFAQAAAIAAAYNTLLALFPSQKPHWTPSCYPRWLRCRLMMKDRTKTASRLIRVCLGQQVASDIQGWRSSDGIQTVLPPVIGGCARTMAAHPARLPVHGYAAVGNHDALRDRVTVTVPSGRTFRLETARNMRPILTKPRLWEAPPAQAERRKRRSSRIIGPETLPSLESGGLIVWRLPITPHCQKKRSAICVDESCSRLMRPSPDGIPNSHFMSWRPVTAIPLADRLNRTLWQILTGGLCGYSPAPEYVSAHAIFSSASAGVLAAYFGDDTTFFPRIREPAGRIQNLHSFSLRSTRSHWPEFTPASLPLGLRRWQEHGNSYRTVCLGECWLNRTRGATGQVSHDIRRAEPECRKRRPR